MTFKGILSRTIHWTVLGMFVGTSPCIAASKKATPSDSVPDRGVYVYSPTPPLVPVSGELAKKLQGVPMFSGIPDGDQPLTHLGPKYDDKGRLLPEVSTETDAVPICNDHRTQIGDALLCLQDEKQKFDDLYSTAHPIFEKALKNYNSKYSGGVTYTSESLWEHIKSGGNWIEGSKAFFKEIAAKCKGPSEAKCFQNAEALWVSTVQVASARISSKRVASIQEELVKRHELPALLLATGAPTADQKKQSKKLGKKKAGPAVDQPFVPHPDLTTTPTSLFDAQCNDFPVIVECPGGEFDPRDKRYKMSFSERLKFKQENGYLPSDQEQLQRAVDFVYNATRDQVKVELAVQKFAVEHYVQTFLMASLAEDPSSKHFEEALKALSEQAEYCSIHDSDESKKLQDPSVTTTRDLIRGAIKKVRKNTQDNLESGLDAMKKLSPDFLDTLGLAGARYASNKNNIKKLHPERFEEPYGVCAFTRVSSKLDPRLSQDQIGDEMAHRADCKASFPMIEGYKAENRGLLTTFPVLGEENLGTLGDASAYIAGGSTTEERRKRAQAAMKAFGGTQKLEVAANIDRLCGDKEKETKALIMSDSFMHEFFDCSFDTSAECQERRSMGWIACGIYRENARDDALKNALKKTAVGMIVGMLPYSWAIMHTLSIVQDYTARKDRYETERSRLLAGVGDADHLEAAQASLDALPKDIMEGTLEMGITVLATTVGTTAPGDNSALSGAEQLPANGVPNLKPISAAMLIKKIKSVPNKMMNIVKGQARFMVTRRLLFRDEPMAAAPIEEIEDGGATPGTLPITVARWSAEYQSILAQLQIPGLNKANANIKFLADVFFVQVDDPKSVATYVSTEPKVYDTLYRMSTGAPPGDESIKMPPGQKDGFYLTLVDSTGASRSILIVTKPK